MKKKFNAHISLLLSKTARFNVLIRRTIRHQQYKAFTSNVLRRDFGFKPRILENKLAIKARPQNFLIPPQVEFYNSYLTVDRNRDNYMEGRDSWHKGDRTKKISDSKFNSSESKIIVMMEK